MIPPGFHSSYCKRQMRIYLVDIQLLINIGYVITVFVYCVTTQYSVLEVVKQ